MIVEKEFNELNIYELYEILKLRSEIFVVEQNSIYQDLDDVDKISRHFMLYENNELIAYLRAIPENVKYDKASFGRVVSKYRKSGNASKLVSRAISYIFDNYSDRIYISSQVQAMNFYKKFGFVEIGDSYIEDQLPHILMCLDKSL